MRRRRRLSLIVGVPVVLSASAGPTVAASGRGNVGAVVASLCAADAKGAGSRTQDPILAGDYYYGDGLGVNWSLKLSRDGQFQLSRHSDNGYSDEYLGAYRVVSGVLLLAPEPPKAQGPMGQLTLHFALPGVRSEPASMMRLFAADAQGSLQGVPTRFAPVAWGSRLYLVPDGDMLRFCNSINEGLEPRDDIHGEFYLRMGDENKPVTGFPHLPQRWHRCLLAKPITGKVVRVAKDGTAIVNIGRRDGLMKGMALVAVKPSIVFMDVVAVDETTSRAKVSYTGEQAGPGASVSTQYR